MSGKLNDSTDYGAFTYKKFTETFFKIEVISDCRYIVKDTDVKTDKEIVHRYQTQEDAWNAAMLCANRQISNASSELIKATIQEKHMSYRGLAKLTGMNVSVISHMCAGTQKRFNKKTIQKLESVLEISIPDISNDAEAIIKDMEEGQTI